MTRPTLQTIPYASWSNGRALAPYTLLDIEAMLLAGQLCDPPIPGEWVTAYVRRWEKLPDLLKDRYRLVALTLSRSQEAHDARS